MASFLEQMREFKEKMKYKTEVRLGIRDERTGLSKDWAGHVINREYIENQIEILQEQLENVIEEEEKNDLMKELDYWEKQLINFEKRYENDMYL